MEGATFGHKGETPGLGAEIAGEDFQKQFEGKKIFDSRNGDFVSVTVQKGGAEKYAGQLENAVDAVSGGTITSNGVTKMLKDCLSCYVPFFERMRGEGRTVDPVAVATDTTAFVPVVGQVAR